MTSRPKKPTAFTLIEVLVATAIMAIVILVTLSMTTNVLTAWNRGAGKLASNFEARVGLDLLSRDLESLIIRNRPMNWLYVGWEKPPVPSRISEFNQALPWMPKVYFLAPVVDRPRLKGDPANPDPVFGDVCAVTYQVAYQNPFTGGTLAVPAPMFALYRFVIDSENTFNSVMDPFGFSINRGSPNGAWLDERMANSPFIGEDGKQVSPQGGVAAFETDTVLQAENFLSANVVDFQMRFYFSDLANPTVEPREQTALQAPNLNATSSLHIADQVYINGTPQPSLTLEYIDIVMTVMSDEGLGILESGSVAADEKEWFDLVAQYGHTFSRRVQIMAKPL